MPRTQSSNNTGFIPQRETHSWLVGPLAGAPFNLDDTIFLYDLTSTYFEGQCPHNPQAKRGYSRDHRDSGA